MTQISPDIKPNPQIDFSSVHSVPSQSSQIKEIQSLYYRQKQQGNSRLVQSFQSLQSKDSKKDSLGYSNTPNKEIVQDHLLRSVMVQQYTSPSLLEELKRKQPLKHNISDFLLEHRTWIPRPPFSAVALWNPIFKRLEEIKNEIKRKNTNGEGWSHHEQIIENQFYRIPEDMLQIITQSTEEGINKQSFMKSQSSHEVDKSLYQISQKSQQNSRQASQRLDQSKDKSMKRIHLFDNSCSRNSNKKGFQSRSLINRISESNLQEEQDYANSQQKMQLNKVQLNKPYQQISEQNVQIQTQNLMTNKSTIQMKINKLTYDELTQQIVKHLRVLQELNNSISSKQSQLSSKKNKQTEKSSIIQKQNDITPSKSLQRLKNNKNQQAISQNSKHQILLKSESQYLKSSGQNVPLTLSQKKQILRQFNQDQLGMMNKMVQSMLLFNGISKNITQTQSRVAPGCDSNQNSNNQSNQSNQSKIKNLNSNISKSSLSSFQKINKSKTHSNTNNHRTHPLPNELKKSLQFKNLQKLMKDQQMKDSILDSLGFDSSYNSGSGFSFVEKQAVGEKQISKRKNIFVKND